MIPGAERRRRARAAHLIALCGRLQRCGNSRPRRERVIAAAVHSGHVLNDIAVASGETREYVMQIGQC